MGRKQETHSGEVAPLEQNEKNLECDGTHYKVVLENLEQSGLNGHMFNVSERLEID